MPQVRLPRLQAGGTLFQALDTMSKARRSACAIVPEARAGRAVVVTLDDVITGINTLGDVALVSLLRSKPGTLKTAARVLAMLPGGAAAVTLPMLAARQAIRQEIVCRCPDNHACRLSDVKVRGRCNIDGKPLKCG